MPDPVATPGAPETPATPPAAPVVPAAPAAPAAPVVTSLIPPADKVTPEVEPQAPTPPTAANQAEAEWFLADGVKGVGKAPEWFRADKYKNVEEQAKAYPEAMKRFGAFTGAPKDGKYDFKLPDGIVGEFDKEHPIFKNFQTWAIENQLSQEGYNSVLGMFAEYEADLIPDVAAIKTALGDNADARIAASAAWAKANLQADDFEAFRLATSDSTDAVARSVAVFKAIEAVIGKTRQVKLPKPGADVPNLAAGGEAAIEEMQARRGPDGKRLFDVDPKYRAMVETARFEFYKSAQKAA